MRYSILLSEEDFKDSYKDIAVNTKASRIGFSGTHSSGKTSVLKAIYDCLPRHIKMSGIAQKLAKDKLFTMDGQRRILKEYIESENLIRNSGLKFVSDRTVFDCLAYCEYVFTYYDNNPAAFDKCVRLFEQHMDTNPYDKIYFFDNAYPISENERVFNTRFSQFKVDEFIRKNLDGYRGVYGCKVNVVRGGKDDIIKAILQDLKQ